MLEGDNLTIQLFIASTAIAVLAIAVTQAGWTQKWFVRSLLVLAAVLFGFTIFWKQVSEQLPHLAEALDASTKGPLPWFVLILASLGLIFVLDFGARVGWFGQEAAASIVGKRRTGITLSYEPGQATPRASKIQNIWRWYSLTQGFRALDQTGNVLRDEAIVTLFLVFDRPVAAKQIVVSASGAPLPRYEVKDFGPRHAIVVLAGHVSGSDVRVHVVT